VRFRVILSALSPRSLELFEQIAERIMYHGVFPCQERRRGSSSFALGTAGGNRDGISSAERLKTFDTGGVGRLRAGVIGVHQNIGEQLLARRLLGLDRFASGRRSRWAKQSRSSALSVLSS
jgi:hypothetical protein